MIRLTSTVLVLLAGFACAAVAWLWVAIASPFLPPWVTKGAEATVVAAMVLQSGMMFPRQKKDKTHKRLLVKHATMRSGSLALVVGAAVTLAGLVGHRRCANGAPAPQSISILRGSNGQGFEPSSALTAQLPLQSDTAARFATCSMAGPETLPAIAVSRGPLDRCCVLKPALARARRAETDHCPERAIFTKR